MTENSKITKTFNITTSPKIMRRIERFFALLHWSSRFGHSGLFAMPLDGDGEDSVTVSPEPKHKHEVDLIGGVGEGAEVALDGGYTFKRVESTKWWVGPSATLYKDSEKSKSIPSKLYDN